MLGAREGHALGRAATSAGSRACKGVAWRGGVLVRLNTLKAGNIFKKGDTETFRIDNQSCFGRITGVHVRTDDASPGPA